MIEEILDQLKVMNGELAEIYNFLDSTSDLLVDAKSNVLELRERIDNTLQKYGNKKEKEKTK